MSEHAKPENVGRLFLWRDTERSVFGVPVRLVACDPELPTVALPDCSLHQTAESLTLLPATWQVVNGVLMRPVTPEEARHEIKGGGGIAGVQKRQK